MGNLSVQQLPEGGEFISRYGVKIRLENNRRIFLIRSVQDPRCRIEEAGSWKLEVEMKMGVRYLGKS